MTEPARPDAARPSYAGVRAAPWFGGLAAFLALLALLGWRMGGGHDPALGVAQPAATASAQRPLLIRRIERRIIVTRVLPAGSRSTPPADDPGPTAVAAALAPGPSAPAPAPLPAAPAPVTRAS